MFPYTNYFKEEIMKDLDVNCEKVFAFVAPVKENIDDASSVVLVKSGSIDSMYFDEFGVDAPLNEEAALNALCYSDNHYIDGSWIEVCAKNIDVDVTEEIW